MNSLFLLESVEGGRWSLGNQGGFSISNPRAAAITVCACGRLQIGFAKCVLVWQVQHGQSSTPTQNER